MRARTILIVDDEEFVRESLVALLENESYSVIARASVKEAIDVLDREEVDALVTDLRMPGEGGLDLLHRTRKSAPDLPVVLLTGVGTVADAVEAMKAGAQDFIQKPVDPDQFLLLIARVLEHRDLVHEVRYLRHAVDDLRGPSELVGVSAELERVRSLVDQVAPSEATVLITGESGTGKELVASRVHRLSRRGGGNLVRVNCAAISETLFESEFFGHRRGSFTSAVSDREGRFAEAEGGTLVLDEIGTLKPDMQAKLLRVLESGEYQVVGESQTRRADVRIVAVTNEDLEDRVREGLFRADLFYRLNVFPIRVPPLRKRRDDIPVIAEHFLRSALGTSAAVKGQKGPLLAKEAAVVLSCYDWPGNVRELRNVIERAVILAGAAVPDAKLLESILGPARPSDRAAEEDGSGDDLNIRTRVDALERSLIERALARTEGRKRDAAALLGIDPKNFGYYLRKHELRDAENGA